MRGGYAGRAGGPTTRFAGRRDLADQADGPAGRLVEIVDSASRRRRIGREGGLGIEDQGGEIGGGAIENRLVRGRMEARRGSIYEGVGAGGVIAEKEVGRARRCGFLLAADEGRRVGRVEQNPLGEFG